MIIKIIVKMPIVKMRTALWKKLILGYDYDSGYDFRSSFLILGRDDKVVHFFLQRSPVPITMGVAIHVCFAFALDWALL